MWSRHTYDWWNSFHKRNLKNSGRIEAILWNENSWNLQNYSYRIINDTLHELVKSYDKSTSNFITISNFIEFRGANGTLKPVLKSTIWAFTKRGVCSKPSTRTTSTKVEYQSFCPRALLTSVNNALSRVAKYRFVAFLSDLRGKAGI